jgi:hypothetical protein
MDVKNNNKDIESRILGFGGIKRKKEGSSWEGKKKKKKKNRFL